MNVTIWHNPNCSKSRQALELLQARGIEPTVRKYLEDPPSEDELRAVLRKLGTKDPHDLVRKREKLYGELGVADMSADEAVTAMASHSKLIERPVVIAGRKARIGRPTEAILEILDAKPAKKAAKKKKAAAAKPNKTALPDETVAHYDTIIASVDGLARKGAKSAYTSRNGHMFSFLTDEGLALRLAKKDRQAHVRKHPGTEPVIQYGSVMREYVWVPDELFRNARAMRDLFRKSWDYIGTLKPKPTKKAPTKKKAAKKKAKKKAAKKK